MYSELAERIHNIPNMNEEPDAPPWAVDNSPASRTLTSRTFINSFKLVYYYEENQNEPVPAWINKKYFKDWDHSMGCQMYRCAEMPLGKPIKRIKRKEKKMEKKCIMVTGHRPDKLPGGYNLESPHNVALRNLFINILEKTQPTSCITGMALGVDQIFALAVLKHKEKYPTCKLIAAVPCPEQSDIWKNKATVALYKDILSKCDYVKMVSPKYDNMCMKVRNLWMIKNCTSAIAIFDGSPGGTSHAVNQLKTAKIPTLIINPTTGERSVENKRK
jgi:uncharacterized phage-like protein YoqJ